MDWKDVLDRMKSDLGNEDAISENSMETAPEQISAPTYTDSLRVLLDRKGRKGKDATIVEGFTIADTDVAAIASRLKQRLGCGGSSRGGEILIQGDKRKAVAAALRAMGFKCKVIG